jgi:hypothetical protein
MKHLLTRLGVYTASPIAFLILLAYAAFWYIFEPQTLEWHGVATLATWAMTLSSNAQSIGTRKPYTPSWTKYSM